MDRTDSVSRLLNAERGVQLPASSIERGWHRLAHDLAAHVAPLPVAAGPLKLGWGLVPKWLMAGFSVGLVGAGTAGSLLAPPTTADSRPTQASSVQRAAPANRLGTASGSLPSPPPAAAPEPQPEPGSEPIEASPPSTAPVTAVPAATGGANFDAEYKLIALAKAALDAHEPARASAWLEDHAAHFPRGVFAREREALRVLAVCERGPRNPRLARDFAALYPSSPLNPRLARACQVEDRELVTEKPAHGERTFEPSTGE